MVKNSLWKFFSSKECMNTLTKLLESYTEDFNVLFDVSDFDFSEQRVIKFLCENDVLLFDTVSGCVYLNTVNPLTCTLISLYSLLLCKEHTGNKSECNNSRVLCRCGSDKIVTGTVEDDDLHITFTKPYRHTMLSYTPSVVSRRREHMLDMIKKVVRK